MYGAPHSDLSFHAVVFVGQGHFAGTVVLRRQHGQESSRGGISVDGAQGWGRLRCVSHPGETMAIDDCSDALIVPKH